TLCCRSSDVITVSVTAGFVKRGRSEVVLDRYAVAIGTTSLGRANTSRNHAQLSVLQVPLPSINGVPAALSNVSHKPPPPLLPRMVVWTRSAGMDRPPTPLNRRSTTCGVGGGGGVVVVPVSRRGATASPGVRPQAQRRPARPIAVSVERTRMSLRSLGALF